jgi:protein-S-isoprenylcysteine O-methyltransferase Ste14
MRPLVYVWPWSFLFWAVFLWAFWPEFAIVRRAQQSRAAVESKSLRLILQGQSIAFLVSFVLAWIPSLRFAPAHARIWLFAGVAMLAAGSVLRRHCWRMLGPSFTGDVQVRADQEVIDRGAYRLLRHPSYAGGILMNTGVGIGLGSWASAAVLGIASVAVYVYRMHVEERALLAAIGEPYRRFIDTRKRLIPFVY